MCGVNEVAEGIVLHKANGIKGSYRHLDTSYVKKALYCGYSRSGLSLLGLCALAFFQGCGKYGEGALITGSYSGPFTASETRKLAETSYSEKCIISTEPPDCRIYVHNKFVGTSPVEVILSGGHADLVSEGHYEYVHDIGWKVGPARRVSETKWQQPEWRPNIGGTWTIKAFKEGYQSEAFVATCGDEVFSIAFKEVNKSDLPQEVVGIRHLLLELSPRSVVSTTHEIYRNVRQDPTEQRNEMYGQAEAEYEAALNAYNEALKALNEATALAAAPKAYPHPALHALMSVAQPYNIAEKERALEIARQRLERAKAKMDHAEW